MIRDAGIGYSSGLGHLFTLSHLNGSDLKMASTGMEGGGSDEDKYLMRSCLNNSNGLE